PEALRWVPSPPRTRHDRLRSGPLRSGDTARQVGAGGEPALDPVRRHAERLEGSGPAARRPRLVASGGRPARDGGKAVRACRTADRAPRLPAACGHSRATGHGRPRGVAPAEPPEGGGPNPE